MIKFTKTLALSAVAFAAFATAQSAQAAQGLSGAYYDTAGLGSLADAKAAIANRTPTATFISTSVCYPACHQTMNDNNTLNAFLGSNATSISANSVNNLAGGVMTLTGFINIATAGTYSFWLRSDDGASLTIDGVSLVSDGLHSLSSVMQDFTLAAGWHTISILSFENDGETGLTVKMNGQPLPTSILQTAVPEPASWAMMIGGFALAGGAMRRRARPAMLAA